MLTEVPVTPATRVIDVVEYCKEAGEGECHLAEVWNGHGESIHPSIHPHTVYEICYLFKTIDTGQNKTGLTVRSFYSSDMQMMNDFIYHKQPVFP